MKVTMMLADAAQIAEGKLYVIGGNWRMTNGRSPSVVILIIEADWTEANRNFSFAIELVDVDGHLFSLETATGSYAQKYLANIKFGRPAELPTGSTLCETMIFGIPPLPTLRPSHQYEWRCTIDGEFIAARSFMTRPNPVAVESTI